MSIVRNFADGMLNLVANLGTRRDKSAHTEYIFTPLSSHDLLSVYRSSWLAKRGIDTPAHDSVRNWRNWRAEAEQISKIEAVETAIELKKKVLEALIASRLYGGSAIYINTGSSSPATPLAATEHVRSLIVLTKDALTSDQINKDIDSEYYGKPETYKIQSNGSPVTIHASRFVIFPGEYVPADVNSQNGWGDSVLQSVIDAVKSADSTVANIASLVFEAKVDVMKVEGFADLLEHNQDDLILRRAVLQAAMKGNNGMLMIDSKDDYQQKTLSFSGMPEVINKFQEWVAGAFKIPVTRLFGRSSAGLSGSGDGDERVYYDGIAQEQRLVIGPALHNLDEIIINQALGTRPAEIWYEWAPLRQMTESERADIFSKTANAARSIAGANAGEIIPLDALSDALVNALTEMGALPGLEASVEEYGSLSEQYEIRETDTQNFADYDPNQPRDPKGRWTTGSGGGRVGGMPPVPDGYVRLYHGSNEQGLGEVNSGGVFGGVFTSEDEQSAESHMLNPDSQLYYVDIKQSDVLTQRDLNYEIDYDAQVSALKKSMSWLDDDDIDFAYEVVIEQNDVWDRDWDDVERVFPRASDMGEASWEGQRIRGLVAKNLGYKAVEMDDEHGTSILVLPGAHLKKVVKSNEI